MAPALSSEHTAVEQVQICLETGCVSHLLGDPVSFGSQSLNPVAFWELPIH